MLPILFSESRHEIWKLYESSIRFKLPIEKVFSEFKE